MEQVKLGKDSYCFCLLSAGFCVCGIGLWSCAAVVEVVDRQDSQRLPGGFCFAIRFVLPFGVAVTISSCHVRPLALLILTHRPKCDYDGPLNFFFLFQQFSRSKITRNEFSEAKKELEGLHRHQSSCNLQIQKRGGKKRWR